MSKKDFGLPENGSYKSMNSKDTKDKHIINTIYRAGKGNYSDFVSIIIKQ